MCGVIGIVSKNILKQDVIKKLIINSKIRGQHATGISYIDEDVIKTCIISKNADYLDLKNVLTKSLIGHARYSTSSLEYNQPISHFNVSIVHNGVITCLALV